MIVTKTPLRISLVGGGTDLPSFYQTHVRGGAVVSFTIDKYVYIAVNHPFEDKVRVSYAKTETVRWARDVQHDIVRMCLMKMGITNRIEIVSVSDIPGKGTGLGSSSAFTVGLLNALTQHCLLHDIHNARHYENTDVAEEACDIEIRLLEKPIGKQDQYACTYGGLNHFVFQNNGEVLVKRIPLSREQLDYMTDRFLLFYTGRTRQSADVLSKQNENIQKEDNTRYRMEKMRDLAVSLYDELLQGNIDAVGELMHRNWMHKKQLADSITDPQIDDWYETAMKHGATGGKILGAGGGGFMLFYAEPEHHMKIREAVNLRCLPFKITQQGTKLVYMEGFND